MNIKITSYKSEYIEDIKNLVSELQDSIKELEPQIIASGSKVKDSYTESLLEEVETKNGQIFIAKDSNKIIGVVFAYIKKEKDEEVEYLFISDLIVTKDERGKGIGKLLINKCEEYAKNKNIKYIRIGSQALNKDAARLYRNMGFEDYLIILHKKIN